MSRITREEFSEYAKELISDGAKVCPCCLHNRLEFTTDDNHNEYWLECKMCHMGVRNYLFSNIKRAWNYRRLNDEKINKITHDIECSWFNGEHVEYITNDKEERETN